MPTFLATQSYVLKPSTTPELTIPGGTIRGMVLEKMEKLVEHVLSQREGEVRERLWGTVGVRVVVAN